MSGSSFHPEILDAGRGRARFAGALTIASLIGAFVDVRGDVLHATHDSWWIIISGGIAAVLGIASSGGYYPSRLLLSALSEGAGAIFAGRMLWGAADGSAGLAVAFWCALFASLGYLHAAWRKRYVKALLLPARRPSASKSARFVAGLPFKDF